MKTLKFNLLLATAALMAASTTASAQTLRADIPFPFTAGKVAMAKGTYELHALPTESLFILRGDAQRSSAIWKGTREDVPPQWKKAGVAKLENPLCEIFQSVV